MVTAPVSVFPPITSILDPSFRGAVPSVATTVAKQAPAGSCEALSISSKSAFIPLLSFIRQDCSMTTNAASDTAEEPQDSHRQGLQEQGNSLEWLSALWLSPRGLHTLKVFLQALRELPEHLLGDLFNHARAKLRQEPSNGNLGAAPDLSPSMGKGTQLSQHLYGSIPLPLYILPFAHQLDLEVLGVQAHNSQLPLIISHHRADLDTYGPHIPVLIYYFGKLGSGNARHHFPWVAEELPDLGHRLFYGKRLCHLHLHARNPSLKGVIKMVKLR